MALELNPVGLKKNIRKNENGSFQKMNSFDGSHKWMRMNNENDVLPNSFHKPQANFRSNEAGDKEEVMEYFNKKFTFESPKLGWTLPLRTEMFKHEKWRIDKFMNLKNELNKSKNKLNDYNWEEWHRHTRVMNKAGSLLWAVKKDIDPEFITQAWLKFYEICSSYDFVCKAAQEQFELNSVHLCEAPGAFITSLNHYLKLNHPHIKWNWISTTLNPYYEGNPLSNMINDDRFILHTLEHWKFGEDFTGDLMDINNMLNLMKEAQNLGPVLMITADGSIDCQNDPGEQESIVSQLLFCEVVTALHILSPGGNFVVKMFTMYEDLTICLMYLLVCSFESVNVYKPASSKEGNSENYVVCLNYNGRDSIEPWLHQLRLEYGHEPSSKAMFPLCDIPEDFLDQLHNCAKKFKEYQVAVIERNVYLFESQNSQQSITKTKRLRFAVTEEFFKRYNLRPLLAKDDQKIVKGELLKNTETPNLEKRIEEGSFNDKIKREKLAPVRKIEVLHKDVHNVKISWEFDEDIKWLQFPPYEKKFKTVVGKSVVSVRSSKFCLGRLLKIRNDIRALAKEYFSFIYEANGPRKAGGQPARELSSQVKGIIQKSFPILDSKVRILNYKETLWESLESGKNECFESNAFFDIMDVMDEEMWRGYHLIIQGYPMLTQFTAGVIYLLGHLFENVGFVRPTGQDFAVIFREYRSRNHKMHQFVEELDSLIEKLSADKEKSVLCVIPLDDLINGEKDFYSCVTAVNNLCVKEQICDIYQRVTRSECSDY